MPNYSSEKLATKKHIIEHPECVIFVGGVVNNIYQNNYVHSGGKLFITVKRDNSTFSSLLID